jgi:ribonuclease BN (tRNA processing enzyme)
VANEHVLFDAGPGTVQRLHAAGVSPFAIDRIFLTHFHLDHCLDMASLLFALRIPQPFDSPPKDRGKSRRIPPSGQQRKNDGLAHAAPPARTKPLTIYGPRGLKRLVRHLNTAFHGWLAPRTYRLTLRELGQTRVRCPGYTVTAKRMTHSTPALGYRIDAQGTSIAYSGDTDVCPSIVELGRNADLLILECSHPDEQKVAGHLTPTDCGRIAAHAHCRHLVLTHFYPVFRGVNIRRCVRSAFSGRLTLARDLLTLPL